MRFQPEDLPEGPAPHTRAVPEDCIHTDTKSPPWEGSKLSGTKQLPERLGLTPNQTTLVIPSPRAAPSPLQPALSSSVPAAVLHPAAGAGPHRASRSCPLGKIGENW